VASEALFALAGAVIGVGGTLTTELVRAHIGRRQAARDVLLAACVDFSASMARMGNLSLAIKNDPDDSARHERMRIEYGEARVCYERLRLLLESQSAQEHARRALYHSMRRWRAAEGLESPDEGWGSGDQATSLLEDAVASLYIEVRRQLGLRQPGDLFREPQEWLSERTDLGRGQGSSS
jgi:hypothetical protein